MSKREINYYGIKITKDENGNDDEDVKAIRQEDLQRFNEDGYDIYWTFNEFSGFGKRKKKDLVAIHAFMIDIDFKDIKRADAIALLAKYLTPSMVIATGNGFHVYWYLDDPIDCRESPLEWAEWYRNFIEHRIERIYKSDSRARDVCRLLRAPFFRYWKDKTKEIFIDIAYDNEDRTYSMEQLIHSFPAQKVEPPKPKNTREIGDSFWNLANAINCAEGLKRLSGSSYVNGEKYTLKKMGKITRILVDGRAHHMWLDEEGCIGSMNGGGPFVPNWLYYFHKDWNKVSEIINKVWPEIGERIAANELQKM